MSLKSTTSTVTEEMRGEDWLGDFIARIGGDTFISYRLIRGCDRMKVLAPTAGPTPASRSADFIAGLCKDIDAEMIVIHVRSKGTKLSETEEKEAFRIFEEAAKEAGVKVQTRLVEGDVVGSILDAAEADSVDLIVMGATGERELKKWIKGNVLIEVMERSTVPVTIIPSALRPDLYR
jgi:nucleotide-binding universal stress UspA family protein